jgi:hypothetical protein
VPTVAHASVAELAAWLPATTPVPADAARLLQRASEVVDEACTQAFWLDTDTSLALDATTATALSEAACAQVEFWLEVGEANDVDGLAGSQIAVPGFAGRRAPVVAPRAARILSAANLRGQMVGVGWGRW